MWHVEHAGLEKKHERHPLIVGLDFHVVDVWHVRPNSRLGHVLADLTVRLHVMLGHGKSSDAVTIIVDDTLRENASVDAIYNRIRT
mgnify:CR=1 FL=1